MKTDKRKFIIYTRKSIIVFTVILTSVFFLGDIACQKSGKVSPDVGYYTCSMHPQVIKQEPGNCPICGMKLVFKAAGKNKKMKTGDHSTHDHNKDKGKSGDEQMKNFRFSLADELLQNAKVYTVPAKLENFSSENTYSGHVDYNEDPNRLVIINTKYDGWIEKLYVSKEGQWISKGELLMGIYSQKILAAKEEYIITYNSLKDLYLSQGKSMDDFQKDSTLLASKRKLIYLDVPSSQITRLEKTGKADRRTYFYSPISGVVITKSVLQGSHINSGQELFRIANLGVLWVFIHIFEKDLPFIEKGQQVSIETMAYPGKKFSGRIDLLYPFFNMKTRDAKVRIVVPNKDLLLKPGMYVNVKVSSSISKKVITIPELAIIYSGVENYVFVSLGEGDFEIRPVIVMTKSEGKAVISRGISENELVVANGQFLLDSEASLKEALEKGQMSGHQH